MDILKKLENEILYMDGATGTMLQAMGLEPGELPETWNLRYPDRVASIHRAYFEAGSHIVFANTFGANGLKFDGKDGRPDLTDVIAAAVDCVKMARDTAVGGQSDRYIALDLGPLGRMLQPLGDMPFERAVDLYAKAVTAGAAAGADVVTIETMNDSYETKAALLAVKENCSLPVFVSNVFDEQGRLMTGADPETMTAILEGLGADAIGMNCSLGPEQMLDLMPRFIDIASAPVIVKPNAGLPYTENGKTVFSVGPEAFAAVIRKAVLGGARLVGGCCGSTPEYIRAIVAATCGLKPIPAMPKKATVISSYSQALIFGNKPIIIGERLNPSGKKRLKEALRTGEMPYVASEGIRQQEQGAMVLDVNVGLPEIDEQAVLAGCVTSLQAVCALPLQLDTTNPSAMEKAMRVYNGKPMINSVNGKAESMDAIFPLMKKYGGVAVCLTLDETGIPETAAGRLKIAETIATRAAQYGISTGDLIFDPLALTIASDGGAAMVTLDTITLIKKRLGAKCILGISNVSFGLPEREAITSVFFALALERGLDAAIMDPASTEMKKAYYSYLALSGLDPNCTGYIAFSKGLSAALPEHATDTLRQVATDAPEQPEGGLRHAIISGLAVKAAQAAREMLLYLEPLAVINTHIVPALDVVGQGYENKSLFLPQLLMSAEAAKAAFEVVKQSLPQGSGGPSVILATVKGDIHDIGKNIVRALLENYGYSIIDLGRDVAPQEIARVAKEKAIRLVGLSALMTTTVPSMAETIKLLRRDVPDCHIMVGGAVLTEEYGKMIGADLYAKNAMEGVRYAARIFDSAK